jgi:hypothetical protein
MSKNANNSAILKLEKIKYRLKSSELYEKILIYFVINYNQILLKTIDHWQTLANRTEPGMSFLLYN